jgi:hypothetical protein
VSHPSPESKKFTCSWQRGFSLPYLFSHLFLSARYRPFQSSWRRGLFSPAIPTFYTHNPLKGVYRIRLWLNKGLRGITNAPNWYGVIIIDLLKKMQYWKCLKFILMFFRKIQNFKVNYRQFENRCHSFRELLTMF